MSTVKTNNVQVGQSLTATNNFTLYQPSTPDGTVRLGVGNTGATTADVVTATNASNVGIGNTSPEVISNFVSLDVGSSSTKQGYIQANDGTTKTVMWSTGGLGKVGTRTVHPLSFQINSSEAAQIDTSSNFKFNSGYGSVATAYGCRAWVNFNGTGTVAIRASGNVSSITDNGVGDYTVNFTNAMPDANYACTYTAVNAAIGLLNDSTTVIAASVRIRSRRGDNVYEDTAVNCVAIHR